MHVYLWKEYGTENTGRKHEYKRGIYKSIGIGIVFREPKHRNRQDYNDAGDGESVDNVPAFCKFGRQIPCSPCLE